MQFQLTAKQKIIHERAVATSNRYKRDEYELVCALRDVQREKLHRLFDCPSLFVYATRILGHSEPTAQMLITLARKTIEVPELLEALRTRRLTACKASRLVAAVTSENAGELIAFAESRTVREVNLKVASLNPKAEKRTVVRAVAGDRVRASMDFTLEEYTLLERAQTLYSKKGGTSLKDVMLVAVLEWLDRNDKVQKAARAMARKAKKANAASPPVASDAAGASVTELCTYRVSPGTESKIESNRPTFKRIPLTAAQRHEVFHRDGSRCTFLNEHRERCSERKYIEVHHILPVSRGGSNDPSNLTTMCAHHHELIHQLSLPPDGQISRIREPTKPYVA